MPTATTPTLAGTTLPVPKEQQYGKLYRGGTLEMADGSIVHDLVDTTVRHRFRLRWEYLTQTEKNSIATAYEAIKNTTGTYLSVENVSYTVTRPDGGEMDVTVEVVAGGELAFHVAIELLEDS